MSTHDAQVEDRELLGRAARWPDDRSLSDLTPEVLCNISRDQGIDFATALLYDRIVGSAEHRPLIDCMHELRNGSASPRPLDATVVFVPGAFYKEYPHTGADAATLVEETLRLGCPAERIPIQSIGTVAENSQIICKWLSRRADEAIILVSLSKGSADVKMALSQPGAEDAFRNVVAWVSLSGTLRGSQMVTWAMSRRWATWFCRMLFWIRGRDFQFVHELHQRPGGALDFDPQIPEHMRFIQIAGFPLARHVSDRRARRWRRRLASYGPNDSVMALSDICGMPGQIFPVWGADHYLRSHWNPQTLTSALLQHLGKELELHPSSAPVERVAK